MLLTKQCETIQGHLCGVIAVFVIAATLLLRQHCRLIAASLPTYIAALQAVFIAATLSNNVGRLYIITTLHL
jgi:hypothetical protein